MFVQKWFLFYIIIFPTISYNLYIDFLSKDEYKKIIKFILGILPWCHSRFSGDEYKSWRNPQDTYNTFRYWLSIKWSLLLYAGSFYRWPKVATEYRVTYISMINYDRTYIEYNFNPIPFHGLKQFFIVRGRKVWRHINRWVMVPIISRIRLKMIWSLNRNHPVFDCCWSLRSHVI